MRVPGFGEDFNGAEFAEAIINTMQMGTPVSEDMRPTFYWNPVKTFSGRTDLSGKPYELGSQPVNVAQNEPMQPPCAVETVDRALDGTAVGEFDNPRAKITIHDNDYRQVESADYVTLSGDKYLIRWRETIALFDQQFWVLHCQAEDAA